MLSPIPEPRTGATAQASVVYYAGGTEVLGRFGTYDRHTVRLKRVPKHVRDAVIAAENRGFYGDIGISPTGIARALWANVTGGRLQGGSTTTQQFVRNYYLTHERTWARKLREAVLAIKIDRQLSKNQILENYLNTIYFGRGAYGIQAAARAYFGIDVDDLSLRQGAALAALIASPGRFDPVTHRAKLAARMRYVLDVMADMGVLSVRKVAARKLPAFVRALPRYGGTKGYLLAAVEAELERRGVSPQQIHAGGLRVVTTIRKSAQGAAVKAVASRAPKKNAQRCGSGWWRSSRDLERSWQCMAARTTCRGSCTRRSSAEAKIRPGSTFKTFALAAALKERVGLFAGNSPLRIRGEPPVRNFNDKDWGARISLLAATQYSVNTAYVDLSMRVGADKVAAAAERAGVLRADMAGNINPRLVLGINSVSPVEMAGAYAAFAAGGVRARPHLVASVTGPHGDAATHRVEAGVQPGGGRWGDVRVGARGFRRHCHRGDPRFGSAGGRQDRHTWRSARWRSDGVARRVHPAAVRRGGDVQGRWDRRVGRCGRCAAGHRRRISGADLDGVHAGRARRPARYGGLGPGLRRRAGQAPND